MLYENWTDVSGLLMADPRIVDKPRPMEEVTYSEIRELSYMGASVLHDEAMAPVREWASRSTYAIPTRRRTRHPYRCPALARGGGEHPDSGVAGKTSFAMITIGRI